MNIIKPPPASEPLQVSPGQDSEHLIGTSPVPQVDSIGGDGGNAIDFDVTSMECMVLAFICIALILILLWSISRRLRQMRNIRVMRDYWDVLYIADRCHAKAREAIRKKNSQESFRKGNYAPTRFAPSVSSMKSQGGMDEPLGRYDRSSIYMRRTPHVDQRNGIPYRST